MENESNTPDFILADRLADFLTAWSKDITAHAQWMSEHFWKS
jgi:hypothetical protein